MLIPQRVRIFLEAIKVSHSVFALPFAAASAFIAARGAPSPALIAKVALACVAARTAAMAFNRFADAEIDARNPRTAARAVPAGLLSRGTMLVAAVAAAAAFAAIALWINRLAFQLAPVALIVLLGYSYTKRFTPLSHLVLGAALGLSPLGAWIAVRGEMAADWSVPALLGLAVLLWTAGFDIIYACQDLDFDRRAGLHSLPRMLGIPGALWVSRSFHVLTVASLVLVGGLAGFGVSYYVGTAVVAALLALEQSIVRAGDLSRVNAAFFTVNGLVSCVFLATVVATTML